MIIDLVYQCLDCRMRYISEEHPITRRCICGGALIYRRDLSIDLLLRRDESIDALAEQLEALQRI